MSQTENDSCNLSATSTSPTEPGFLEAPLAGLCTKPMHEMTEEERRAKVMEIRELRANKARFNNRVKEPTEKVPSVPTGLEDLI